MADYAIIADLGNQLVRLLRSHLCPEPIQNPEAILLCPPFEKGDYILGVHLYDMQEDGDYPQTHLVSVDEKKRRFPPVALTLYYMITVSSQAQLAAKALDEQRIFGKVLQLLHDYPLFSPVGFSQEKEEEIISLAPHLLSFEEKSRLWSNAGSGNGARLALYYKAAPVLIDSARTVETGRVVSIDVRLRERQVDKDE